MNISEQTCLLVQAKEFKKLGVSQCAYIHFYIPNHNDGFTKKGVAEYRHAVMPAIGWDKYYSAYTGTELGIVLPEWVYSKKNSGGGEPWCCLMVEDHSRLPQKIKLKDFYGENEAIVRAKMLLYLLKNKLVSLVQVNKILEQKKSD